MKSAAFERRMKAFLKTYPQFDHKRVDDALWRHQFNGWIGGKHGELRLTVCRVTLRTEILLSYAREDATGCHRDEHDRAFNSPEAAASYCLIEGLLI